MIKGKKSKWLGLALVGISAVMGANAYAAANVTISGSVHTDFVGFSGEGRTQFVTPQKPLVGGNGSKDVNRFPSGFKLAKARLNFNVEMGEMKAKVGLDAANKGISIKDAYVAYTGFAKGTTISLGQKSPTFGLENCSSNDNHLFMDSAMGNVFGPKTGTGLYLNTVKSNFGLNAGVFTKRLFSEKADGISDHGGVKHQNNVEYKKDTFNWVVQGHYSPKHVAGEAYHLSAGYYHHNYKDGEAFGGYATEMVPNARNSLTGFIRAASKQSDDEKSFALSLTGKLTGNNQVRIDSSKVLNLGAAAVRGPITVMGEYNQAKLKGQQRLDDVDYDIKPKFTSFNVEAGYMLTGESRPYDFKSGAIGRPTPASDCGAWEVAARYDYINLDHEVKDKANESLRGYKANRLTLGVNYFFNENVALKFNYSTAKAKDMSVAEADRKDKKLNAFGVRLQAAI